MATAMTMARRGGTLVRWPVGMALTSWRYLWRTTALHRVDEQGLPAADRDEPAVPEALSGGLQRSDDGFGDFFHRRYQVRIDQPESPAAQLMASLAQDPGRPAPIEVAVFWKTRGRDGQMRPGDEFVVRMPGPWDGPVRVVDRTATSFRLATLPGHLEAGQIEFRAWDADETLVFEIESWTCSGDRFSELLYSRLRLIKEMQLHMWTHYCEHVSGVAGGRMVGGVHIHTRRREAD
jgi:hypothetical protein